MQKVLDTTRRRPLNFIPQCKQPIGEMNMSLEAKIAELTLAVQALTHAVTQSKTIETIVSPTAAYVDAYRPPQQYGLMDSLNTAADQATITQREKEIVAEEVKAGNESSTPPSGAQFEPEPQKSSLTYDDVKRATNNLSAAKGKEITIAALARFGVKRATELTESQWPEYCSYTADCAAGKIDPREAA